MDAVQETSIGIAVVSLISSIATALFAYLRDRSAKEFDLQLAMLREENEDLRGELAQCREHHKESEEDRAELWKQLQAAIARADAAAEAAKKAEARIAELESRIGKA